MQRAQTSQLNYQEGCRFSRPGGDGPSTQVMINFIDENKQFYGVEPICRVLPIAPSTYYRAKDLSDNPYKRSLRSQHDDDYISDARKYLFVIVY